MVGEKVTNPYYWALIMNLSPETMDEFVHLLPDLDVRTPLLEDQYASTSCTFESPASARLDWTGRNSEPVQDKGMSAGRGDM